MRVASPLGNLTINTFEKGEHVDNIAVEKEFNREALGEKNFRFFYFVLDLRAWTPFKFLSLHNSNSFVFALITIIIIISNNKEWL